MYNRDVLNWLRPASIMSFVLWTIVCNWLRGDNPSLNERIYTPEETLLREPIQDFMYSAVAGTVILMAASIGFAAGAGKAITRMLMNRPR